MGLSQKVTLDFDLLATICSCKAFSNYFGISNQFFIFNHVNQKVSHTNKLMDRKLIKASSYFFEIFKRECLYIAAHTNFGEIFYSRIIKGSKSNVSNAQEIYEETRKLRNKLRSRGITITKFEIVHSHMKEEYVEFDEKSRASRIKTWSLSASDIEVFKYLAQKVKAPILMRAVTQKYISYEITS